MSMQCQNKKYNILSEAQLCGVHKSLIDSLKDGKQSYWLLLLKLRDIQKKLSKWVRWMSEISSQTSPLTMIVHLRLKQLDPLIYCQIFFFITLFSPTGAGQSWLWIFFSAILAGSMLCLPQAPGKPRLSEEPHEAPHGREASHLPPLWEVLQPKR